MHVFVLFLQVKYYQRTAVLFKLVNVTGRGIVIDAERETCESGSNPTKCCCVDIYTNGFGKDVNHFLLSSAMSKKKTLENIGFFSLFNEIE